MIEVRGLTRRYGGFVAVDDVSFAAREGEILGMLGPNGAGKTTTLRMITGFMPPSSGEIVVAGRSLLTDSVEARRRIGYLPEVVALYGEMRVREYLAYRARLYGLGPAPSRQAIANTVERCLLADVVDQVIGTLSKGYRQRVGLAAAILHDPQVLVLDEPTIGLDPKQIIAIRELIRDLGRRRTVLLSTHILPEVELLCDRVQIIDHGRIVAEGTPSDLAQQWVGRASLRLTLEVPASATGDPGLAEDVITALAGVDGVVSVAQEEAAQGERSFNLECDADRDSRADVFRLAVERGWVLLGLEQSKPSLEDVFIRLTRAESSEADGAGDSSREAPS